MLIAAPAHVPTALWNVVAPDPQQNKSAPTRLQLRNNRAPLDSKRPRIRVVRRQMSAARGQRACAADLARARRGWAWPMRVPRSVWSARSPNTQDADGDCRTTAAAVICSGACRSLCGPLEVALAGFYVPARLRAVDGWLWDAFSEVVAMTGGCAGGA